MGLEMAGSCNKSQLLYVVIITHLAISFVFVNWRHKFECFLLSSQSLFDDTKKCVFVYVARRHVQDCNVSRW